MQEISCNIPKSPDRIFAMMISNSELESLRLEIARTGIRRKHVADKLGMTESRFSRILSGNAPAPEGFRLDCEDAIQIVQEAERAAREAFGKVMGGERPSGQV